MTKAPTSLSRAFLYILPVLICISGLQSCMHAKLTQMAPIESYPADTWLSGQTHKKALIIVAHDDDAMSCAGTVSMLTAQGWDIEMLCFYTALPADSVRNRQRMQDIQVAAKIQGIRGVTYHALNYRLDHGSATPLFAYTTPEQRDSLFKMDTLRQLVHQFIDSRSPSVIFTLDEVIGGYGHPDHAVISGIVKSYVLESPTTVQRIYQAVFTPHQAETIMADLPVYQRAKQLCQCAGMPLPNTQIYITPYAQQKQSAMQAYSTEQHNIQKFWPKYDKMPAASYFGLFDREFFRVITK